MGLVGGSFLALLLHLASLATGTASCFHPLRSLTSQPTSSSSPCPILLLLLQTAGTQVVLEPEQVVLAGFPRAALWATLMAAVLDGRLSLVNVRRPEVTQEDLPEICDIFRVRAWGEGAGSGLSCVGLGWVRLGLVWLG